MAARDCLRTWRISAPCEVCGVRDEPCHSPLLEMGFFCSRHCPACNGTGGTRRVRKRGQEKQTRSLLLDVQKAGNG